MNIRVMIFLGLDSPQKIRRLGYYIGYQLSSIFMPVENKADIINGNLLKFLIQGIEQGYVMGVYDYPVDRRGLK